MRSEVFLQLGRICFWTLLRQSENFSIFCNVFPPFRTIFQIPKVSSSACSRSLALPHMFFWHNETLQTVCSFSWVYEVAQYPHESNMAEANTGSVLARFCDNNWEKGEDFVKICRVKKSMCGRHGGLLERARMTRHPRNACLSLRFVVDTEKNRASEMLLEVFQKGIHRDASLSWLLVARKFFQIPRNQNWSTSRLCQLIWPIKFTIVNKEPFAVVLMRVWFGLTN